MNWGVFFTVLAVCVGATLISVVMVLARDWIDRRGWLNSNAACIGLLAALFLSAAAFLGAMHA